jgi:hypothetical protein
VAVSEQTMEFDCADCGRHVLCFGYTIAPLICSSCEWVRAWIPPEQQAETRQRMGVPLVPPRRYETDFPT